ncbi:signal peptidase I [bacterium]|nr:signal peptidase I [bacterium]
MKKKVSFFEVLGMMVLGFFVFIFLLFLLFFMFTFAFPGRANGISMTPTIKNGAFMRINMNAYTNKSPERGDIISIDSGEHKNLIKRIIALPGETIEWRDYEIWIDNQKLNEPYMFDKFTHTYKQTNQFDSVTLKENEYFVMGDNRSYSTDSRYFGPIKKDNISGKVYCIFNFLSK